MPTQLKPWQKQQQISTTNMWLFLSRISHSQSKVWVCLPPSLPLFLPLTGRQTSEVTGGNGGHCQQSSCRRGHVPLSPCLPRLCKTSTRIEQNKMVNKVFYWGFACDSEEEGEEAYELTEMEIFLLLYLVSLEAKGTNLANNYSNIAT